MDDYAEFTPRTTSAAATAAEAHMPFQPPGAAAHAADRAATGAMLVPANAHGPMHDAVTQDVRNNRERVRDQLHRTRHDKVKRFFDYVAGGSGLDVETLYTVDQYALYHVELEPDDPEHPNQPPAGIGAAVNENEPWMIIQAFGAPIIVNAMRLSWGDWLTQWWNSSMDENATLKSDDLWRLWADLTIVAVRDGHFLNPRRAYTKRSREAQTGEKLRIACSVKSRLIRMGMMRSPPAISVGYPSASVEAERFKHSFH